MRNTRVHGFTLLEVLLSIGIITILTGIMLPVYRPFQTQNNLDVAAQIITQTLHRAQVLSQSGQSDAQWGVYVQTGSTTLFQGVTYASRSMSFDELYEISPAIVISGAQEFVFTKLRGELSVASASITLSTESQSRTLSVNKKGMIND